jgi:hypothetical protein
MEDMAAAGSPSAMIDGATNMEGVVPVPAGQVGLEMISPSATMVLSFMNAELAVVAKTPGFPF